MSVRGRAMLWNAHCRIPSQVPCRAVYGVSHPVPLTARAPLTPLALPAFPIAPHPSLCLSPHRHGLLWMDSDWCCPPELRTSPSSASSSSLLITGSLPREMSSVCGRRHILPAILPARTRQL